MLIHLRDITNSYKPVTTLPSDMISSQSVLAAEERDNQLWNWLLESLSEERFRQMTANLENLCTSETSEGQANQIQKAKEIELLALKLDID
jgi:hypothetical protein